MDADTSGHSADSICSDDTEYLLGQNVSIREIDDDDLQIHQNAKISSSRSRAHHISPKHSPQKLQPKNSKNLRSPPRKENKAKPGNRLDEFQRSPSHGTAKHPSAMEPSISKVKGKQDKKSKVPHGYVSNEGAWGHGEKGQIGYEVKGVRHTQDFERTSKSKKVFSDSYAKHQQSQRRFQSPEDHKSVHMQDFHKVTGSPSLNSECNYDAASRGTPPTRERSNAKQKHMEPGRSLLRQNLPVIQDNWEVDSEFSSDMVNGGQNTVDVDSNDMESEMSEATEDLIGGQDVGDEDLTEKLKELNLAVNYDPGTNGECLLLSLLVTCKL